MSSMRSSFFSSSSKSSKTYKPDYVVDFDKLKYLFLYLVELDHSTINLKQIPTLFENTKVVKNKANSKPEYIAQVKNLFEKEIDTLKSKENISKNDLAIVIISLYNFFDNIENDNHTTLLGDYAPLSTNKAISNFIEACKTIEQHNIQINVLRATALHTDAGSVNSVSASQDNSLAASTSGVQQGLTHLNIDASIELNEIPFAIIENTDDSNYAIAIANKEEIERIINNFKSISNAAAVAIFGDTKRNSLNSYLQPPRFYPVLLALFGADYMKAYSGLDINFELYPKYTPILNFLANFVIVAKAYKSKKEHIDKKIKNLFGKLDQEATELKNYIQKENLEPINLSNFDIGIPPMKSWLEEYNNNSETKELTCSLVERLYVVDFIHNFTPDNQKFIGKVLSNMICGEKLKSKTSIFNRFKPT